MYARAIDINLTKVDSIMGLKRANEMVQSKDVFRVVLIVLATLAVAYILLMSIRILVVLLVAIIIASAVRPLVDRLTRWRFSEGLAIVLVYVSIVLGIFMLSVIIIPPIANQLMMNLEDESRLVNRLLSAQTWLSQTLMPLTGSPTQLAEPAAIRAAVEDAIQSIQQLLPSLVGGASSTLGEAVLTFVMGVYWLTSYKKAVDFITQLFSLQNREKVQSIIYEIEGMMGSYVRGIIFVAVFVGTANFIILLLLRIPNAATLGFIIGLGTMLPIVGGFLGGGTAVFLALIGGSPVQALAVLATFVGVQQVETNYLTPRAMSRSVRLDPLLTIIAVLIGFTLYGVIGAIVAAPLMGTLAVLLRIFVFEPRRANVSGFTIQDGLVLLKTESPPASADGA